MRWYVSRNGETGGPYPEAQVRAWLRAGEIGHEVVVRQEDATVWTPIGKSPLARSGFANSVRRLAVLFLVGVAVSFLLLVGLTVYAVATQGGGTPTPLSSAPLASAPVAWSGKPVAQPRALSAATVERQQVRRSEEPHRIADAVPERPRLVTPAPPSAPVTTRAPAAAKPPKKPAPPRTEPRMLLCRDGTTSPTCECGGPRRGCCSHHGGVAGCEP